ncbi:MAG TPA: hypothetical protein PLZ82_03095 [Smithellaceae bacterium]|jgi:hypothetical protein|nr:hypothetical protein [Syntrophaceae bacterium]NMC91721.1 hypothetical protein [Smithella sp.]OQC73786.1 MAG: hypothetical protein BWX45_00295 [Deltaproteobacteria bacterium ADurb.Bin002]HNV57978.1 hypothetical protein [Smithellaceae bacterium]MBP8664911.1 hypothetical protein [Syntrophaceae bacterium]
MTKWFSPAGRYCFVDSRVYFVYIPCELCRTCPPLKGIDLIVKMNAMRRID